MRTVTLLAIVATAWAGLARGSTAAEPDTQALARQLSAATVTVRVTVPPEEGVVVSSGVSLDDGYVVTFSNHPGNAEYRVTLPDGAQAVAEARVIDLYSGLTLLQLRPQQGQEMPQLGKLSAANEVPPVGAVIVTAAASGLEQPVVSRGILGGVERTLGGSGLPPLLQCDVRTTDTSSGAAVVNADGELVGIVAVTAREGRSGGWTYAVPVSHVERLRRALAQKQAGEDRLVILQRQRPVLGLTMVAGEEPGTVMVERLAAKGPAEKCGVAKDDQIVEVDGLKVRSVYQVVALVLKKQPGDRMEFVVRRGGTDRKIAVTLAGGSVVEPSQVVRNPAQVAEHKITIRRSGDQYDIDRPKVLPLAQGAPAEEQPQPQAPPATKEQLDLLQEQVTRFATYIERLRESIRERDEELIKLRQEVEDLRKQVGK